MSRSTSSDSTGKWKEPKELSGKVEGGQVDEEDLGQWVQAADGSSERRTTHNSHDDQEGSHDEYGKETREVRAKLF